MSIIENKETTMALRRKVMPKKISPMAASQPVTLINSDNPITVEQLLTALQEAIKIDPTIATKRVLHQNPLGNDKSYRVEIQAKSIFISSNYPSRTHCTCCDCELCQEMKAEVDKDYN